MSKALDSLLAAAAYNRTPAAYNRTPAAKRLPPKTIQAIASDLREVVKAEKAGKPTPGRDPLTKYLRSEYKIAISHFTATKWLNQVRAGESIS